MADRVWAPWRMQYIRRSKPADGGCVLCEYAGQSPSRDSLVLARRRGSYVVLNRYPYTAAHLMIVPARHVPDVADLEPAAHDELWRLTREALVRLRKATGCPGANLGMNLGSAAGAGIEQHLHAHVVPRWPGDHNFMPVIADLKVMQEYLEDTWDHLAPHFSDLAEEA